jgi:hypothetical protein
VPSEAAVVDVVLPHGCRPATAHGFCSSLRRRLLRGGGEHCAICVGADCVRKIIIVIFTNKIDNVRVQLVCFALLSLPFRLKVTQVTSTKNLGVKGFMFQTKLCVCQKLLERLHAALLFSFRAQLEDSH